jgi:hypothetical protein
MWRATPDDEHYVYAIAMCGSARRDTAANNF